jgi:dynein heavy chain
MSDTLLFQSITSDIFPGVTIPASDQTHLLNAIKEACVDSNTQDEPAFVAKCFQLNDTLNVRHGLMCVGQAFSGKSKVVDILAKALSKLTTKNNNNNTTQSAVSVIKLNPKAVTTEQLYGVLDPDTK